MMAASRRAEMEAFIRQEAIKRNINPDIAVRVAESEALNAFDPDKPDRGGDEGSSFGLYQLHYAGLSPNMPNPGLGDEFTKLTGLDARDPSTWKQQVTFSLDHAKKKGWGSWMGAKKAGIADFAGIGPGGSGGGTSPNAGATAPGTATPATATGSAPAGTTLTTPTGEVAPYKIGETLAPAIVINQQPAPSFAPVADANPWSSLGGSLAGAVDPNKPQFLAGGVDSGPPPPLPEFESALPPASEAPDITPITPDVTGGEGGISPLGGAFRIAENIGKAATPKLDRYGRPLTPVSSFG
jgi:hypothetical protein